MQKVRYRGPNYYRPHSTQRSYFAPAFNDAPPRSQTRSYAPAKSRAEIAELRRAAAVHEAGHTIVSLHYGNRVARVEIGDEGGGLTSFNDRPLPLEASSIAEDGRSFDTIAEGLTSLSRSEIYPVIVEYEAGAVAESMFDVDEHQTEQSAREDHRRCRVLARQVCDDEIDAREFLANARRRATRILECNRTLLRELSGELERRGRLDGDQIAAIVADFPVAHPLKPKRVADVAPRNEADWRGERPYLNRGPEALGLQALDYTARMPPLSMHERAGSPHDQWLFERRMRFLDGKL